MHRTLGAVHDTLLSLRERVIQFVFDSFLLLVSHQTVFLLASRFSAVLRTAPPSDSAIRGERMRAARQRTSE